VKWLVQIAPSFNNLLPNLPIILNSKPLLIAPSFLKSSMALQLHPPPHLLLLLLSTVLRSLCVLELFLNDAQLALVLVQVDHSPALVNLASAVQVALDSAALEARSVA
jgi:hypothetical protein